MLAGCSQNAENGKAPETADATIKESAQPQTDTEKKETAMPVTKLDIENYNLDYNEKTDAQPFISWSRVAKSDKGYYLWGEGDFWEYLMFFDLGTQQSVPVCNLPNCSHTGKTCNAYFSGGDKDNIWKDGLWYYEDSVYVLGCDAQDYINLYKVKPDGSSREKYMQLYRADTSSTDNNEYKEYWMPELVIHRGYVYYIDRKEKNPKLRRIELGSTETEILYETGGVFETEGDKPELFYIKGYGDYIFFQRTSVFGEEQKELAGLYAYNTQTEEVTFVSNSIKRDFTVFENEIYYCKEKELCKFSIQTQKDEKLMDYPKGITAVSVDSDTISILSTKDNKIRIYDRNLKLLYEDAGGSEKEGDKSENENDEILEYYKGDENFFFAHFGVEKSTIRRLDKSKIKDKTAKWEVMY